ncbi:MAG TPA: hypothetical protein DDY31_08140, partial [Lachnospiraceae bacterium]|nr:hypothetical protein [Lachnospiraceae bacterium]
NQSKTYPKNSYSENPFQQLHPPFQNIIYVYVIFPLLYYFSNEITIPYPGFGADTNYQYMLFTFLCL